MQIRKCARTRLTQLFSGPPALNFAQQSCCTFGARVFFFLPGHQFRSPGRRYVSKKTNYFEKKSLHSSTRGQLQPADLPACTLIGFWAMSRTRPISTALISERRNAARHTGSGRLGLIQASIPASRTPPWCLQPTPVTVGDSTPRARVKGVASPLCSDGHRDT